MTFSCYYHPDREANAKCEICGKLICLDCKMILRRYQGTQNSRSIIRYEVCPICFYDKKEKEFGKNAKLFALMMTIPSTIFIIVLLSFNIFFYMVIGLAILIALSWVYALYYAPKKRDEFMNNKSSFLRGLKDHQIGNRCRNCGAIIDPDALICSYCGIEK